MEDVKVKSLYRALKLLDYFTIEVPQRGITELAELSGMLKSTVHNVVSTFQKCGFLEQNSDNNKYRLGMKILELNNNLYMTNDLRNTVHPFLMNIANFSNECVYFGIPSENEVVYLDAVYSNGNLSGRSIVGIKAPLYCTGVGKAIMAYSKPEVVDEVIGAGLKAFTQNTITDKNKLLEEIDLIKIRNFAIDNMEHEYGIKCVSVPVKNIRGNIVGSISISGPSLRFSDDKISEYAKYLMEISNQLKVLIQR